MKATIVTLLDTPAFGGAEQYVLDSSEILNKNGHKILIYTNNEHVKSRYLEYINANKLKNFEVKHLPYSLDAIGDWKGLVKFFIHLPKASSWFYQTLKEIKQKDNNVICLFVGYTDRLVMSPIAKYLKAKLIWVDIGPLGPIFKRTWGIPKLLYLTTKGLPDHFTTTSKFTRTSMISVGKIPKAKITLVYPGIKLFTQTQINKYIKTGLIWREKNISEEILVGFVGRMAGENEIDLLIKGFAKATKSSKKKMHLVLMGDGPENKRFKNLAKKLGVSNQTTFRGFVSTHQKFSTLAACDLFVFPRAWSWDGFGITTIEAMSVGTPVISPAFGPQLEIVKDGVNGLNFKPKNNLDLARKILIMSKSKKIRDKFSKLGLKTTKEKFSYKIMEQSLLTAVSKV